MVKSLVSEMGSCVCVAGYQWTDIAGCVEWMKTFASMLEDEGPAPVRFSSKVSPAEAHTLQTRVVCIKTVVSESIFATVVMYSNWLLVVELLYGINELL